MKKWFKDDTLATQPLSREAATLIFQVPEDAMETMMKEEKFVVFRTIRTKTQSIQVTINTAMSLKNNAYVIFGFDLDDTLIWAKSIKSHTVVPPVWDRLFGGLDYTDWLSIQHQIKRDVPDACLEIDESIGKTGDFSFYFTQEKDAYERLHRGEGYHLYCVFAGAKPELVESAKAFVAREFGGLQDAVGKP